MNTPLIKLGSVSFAPSKKRGLRHLFGHLTDTAAISQPASQPLLSDITLTIHANELISIIGPNGAGKSTLMLILLGLRQPTQGRVWRSPDLRMGYVPQSFSIPAILPVRVQDLLGQTPCHLDAKTRRQLLARLRVDDLLPSPIQRLSGGETQRLLLARALLTKPNLLILDEPMQGLDPETETDLYAFIDDLPQALRCAMVVVSHDLHWVMRGSRRVICLNKHICCEGKPRELETLLPFQDLFGHQYQRPYIHKPHQCSHQGHFTPTQEG